MTLADALVTALAMALIYVVGQMFRRRRLHERSLHRPASRPAR